MVLCLHAVQLLSLELSGAIPARNSFLWTSLLPLWMPGLYGFILAMGSEAGYGLGVVGAGFAGEVSISLKPHHLASGMFWGHFQGLMHCF